MNYQCGGGEKRRTFPYIATVTVLDAVRAPSLRVESFDLLRDIGSSFRAGESVDLIRSILIIQVPCKK